MSRAKASWNEDHLVPVWRNGRIEEAYWTYSYSPVFRDDGVVGGTLVVCSETTSRFIAARRQGALRALAKSTAPATTVPAALAAASALLDEMRSDVPFALMYLIDGVSGEPALWRAVGLDEAQRVAVDAACRSRLTVAAGRGPVDLRIGRRSGSPSRRCQVAPGRSRRRRPSWRRSGMDGWGGSAGSSCSASAHGSRSTLRIETTSCSLPSTWRSRLVASRPTRRGKTRPRSETRSFASSKAANRAKDEFLAMLGHELRNPLSPIVTALEL